MYLDYVDVLTKTDILFEAIDKNTEVNSKEDEVYFYHGDHLGSANWITDIKGDAIQYMHYAPYGELIDNQRAVSYDERYKFTGKDTIRGNKCPNKTTVQRQLFFTQLLNSIKNFFKHDNE